MFTARTGHRCPALTTTRTKTVESRTRREGKGSRPHNSVSFITTNPSSPETILENGVPVSRRTSNYEYFRSESHSSSTRPPPTRFEPIGTSAQPQYSPRTVTHPVYRRIPAAETLLIAEPSDYRSVRSTRGSYYDDDDDSDGDTRLRIRGGGGGGGGDESSSSSRGHGSGSGSGSESGREDKILHITWTKGRDGKKQYYLDRKK